jgi:NNP family nitrate/nitrite transporter-like MFS transporter
MMPQSASPSSTRRHITLGTLSFMVCFAAWGLVSAFAPQLRGLFGLSATQTALLVTVPVLLGALARLPMGILADRFGGRGVFAVLMLGMAGIVFWAPSARSFGELLFFAFLIGFAGSSFAVGVSYVARWVPPERQGTALGIYGMGNAGQSAIVFLGPLLGARLGWAWVFRGVAVLLLVWGLVFTLLARNAPARGTPKTLGATLGLLRREPLAWVLALFYFLTFGGFVAFAIYLPTLLRDEFGLAASDAGLRAAGFVLLATLCRPVGGVLADRIGGARVLAGVFFGIVPFALLLGWPALLPFTVGALGCALLLGLGNGAVFRLVPEYFPHDTGTVTGLVGALGGMGGFFPPLLLGAFRDLVGAIWPGFVLLSATALALGLVNRRVFLRRQETHEVAWPPEWIRVAHQLRAAAWASLAAGLLAAAVLVGSRNLENFDPALVVYTFAVLFATWGGVYHYRVWLEKPPTRRYFRRTWQLVRAHGLGRSLMSLGRAAATHLLGQTFILRRSGARWWAHQLIFWGCVLAAAITFPLVFGWVHFRTGAADGHEYVTYLFGFPVASFHLYTAVSWLLFHGLDVAAILVLAGIALALGRRFQERGALALQGFSRDFFPLVLLFAISVTGLALTMSTLWMRGAFYEFLALIHAITVIMALLYLPFGKFFHIFQRPAQLGVKLYQEVGAEGEGAICPRCGERFASRMHIEDLREVLGELGFDYRMPGPAGHWQALCPPCKRKSLATAQLRLRREKETH